MNLVTLLLSTVLALPGLSGTAAPQSDSHTLQLAINLPALQDFNEKVTVTAAQAPTPPPAPPAPAPAPQPAPAPKPAPVAPLAPKPVIKPTPKPAPVITPVVAYPALAMNSAKLFIYDHESGNNPYAVNSSSGACGLGQALPCSKLTSVCRLGDYNCEDNFFTRYMQAVYGTWQNAYDFWLKMHWW